MCRNWAKVHSGTLTICSHERAWLSRRFRRTWVLRFYENEFLKGSQSAPRSSNGLWHMVESTWSCVKDMSRAFCPQNILFSSGLIPWASKKNLHFPSGGTGPLMDGSVITLHLLPGIIRQLNSVLALNSGLSFLSSGFWLSRASTLVLLGHLRSWTLSSQPASRSGGWLVMKRHGSSLVSMFPSWERLLVAHWDQDWELSLTMVGLSLRAGSVSMVLSLCAFMVD